MVRSSLFHRFFALLGVGLRNAGRRLEGSVRRRLPDSTRGYVRRLLGRPTRRLSGPALATGPTATRARLTRGTILIVAHDANVGGAQKLARVFGRWLLSRTSYDVKFVVMHGGGQIGEYAAIAPVLDLSALPPDEIPERLHAFADEPLAILVNSVASGEFLRHWQKPTPVVAYIHELSKLLQAHAKPLGLIRERASLVVAGSEAVATTLREEYGFTAQQLRVLHGFIEDDLPCHGGSPFERREAKEAIGLEPDTMLVTACGVAHWRKSPQKFVQVAASVLARTRQPVRFVWVGHGPDQAECEALVKQLGIQREVTFTGYQADIHPFLRASDLFLLPSEEDPFPLVCLYAGLASIPVVCFADAGGMPELVSRGGGRVVPFGDVEAMADAVLTYFDDADARASAGRAMQAAVVHRHTVATAGPSLLHWIREAADLRPHVSVVVPNYNYARFLTERLESLRRQTYQDFEVVLLDDHSSDGSVPLLEAWAATRPGTPVLINDTNGGSPFAQWLRGIARARGELVWIAEADDTCASDFLEHLVPRFDDRNVFLAYSKSTPIDINGAVLGDYEPIYLDRIEPGRWSRDYAATDHEEANAGLGIANCIPNASSVVFRRFQPEPAFAAELAGMRLCGDWLFYLRAMRGGFVSYCAKALNMHRRHDGTVTHGTEGTSRYFAEFGMVRRFVVTTYRLTDATRRRIEVFTADDERRFVGSRNRTQSGAESLSAHLPCVLFVTSDLSPGGGQLFLIRLANEWVRRGGRALIFNVGKFPDHPAVVAKISSRIPVFTGPQTDPADLVARFGVDLVHSAIWWADTCVLRTAEQLEWLPWVITMHGCHETLLDHAEVDPRFPQTMTAMLRRADAWVHTADKNERVFARYGSPRMDVRIDNGVEVEVRQELSRNQVGLSSSAFIACLASRAIPQKGWAVAVAAVQNLRAAGRNVELLLVGEGPAADALRRERPEGVRLVGQVSNLQDYLALADVVVLPSHFVGESLPLVLLEAMALGKPIIATPLGEIPTLVGSGDDAAGTLVPLVDGVPDVFALAEAIDRLTNADLRAALGRAARERFVLRYTLDAMTDRYETLYRECISSRQAAIYQAA